jgi:ABC-2 type transport system permease protein
MRLLFFRKEFFEFFRTYRFYVLFGVFAFFGLLNAPTAKFLPEILKSVPDVGFEIQIPEPVYTDAHVQFASNVTNAFFALIIVFMGSFSKEIKKGTAYLVLSKGVSRGDFFFSKFLNALLMYTLSYAAYSAISVVLTMILFSKWEFTGFGAFLLSPYIFGVLILSAVLGAGSLARSVGPGVFTGFVLLIFMPMTDFIKKAGEYLPGRLASLPAGILNGSASAGDILFPAISAGFLSVAIIVGSYILFAKREL